MKLERDQISDIVSRVVERLEKGNSGMAPAGHPAEVEVELAGHEPTAAERLGEYSSVNEAVASAGQAFESLQAMSLEKRQRMVSAMRDMARKQARNLARMAVEETGMGRVEDKYVKNMLAIDKTPGVEIIKPIAYTGDNGVTLTERAPYGVIGSITPCTNPLATIICNAIGMISAGNAVVFNAHPTAKRTAGAIISLLNKAIISAGGPATLLTSVSPPTIATAQELMRHPGVRLLVVTGGPAVVKTAMGSGKKVIAAGPGNPPAVVDETANLADAAKHIIYGASFDNNIVCVVEKEIICVGKVADQLKAEMKKQGAVELGPMQIRKVEKLLVGRPPAGPGDHGMINKQWVGKNATEILAAIGVDTREDVRLIFCEVDRTHPLFIMEQLTPVIPLVRVNCVDEAIALAKEVEHGFRHTAMMHSTNIDNLSKMARVMDTSIFVKNGPSVAGLGAGGEGYTSFTIASPTGEGLTTAMTFTRERRCVLKDRFRIV